MSSKIDISDPAILRTYYSLWQQESGWMIITYRESAQNGLYVKNWGTDFKSFVQQFQSNDRIQFAYLKSKEKGLLLVYIAPTVDPVASAYALVHGKKLGKIIEKHQGFITITSYQEVNEDSIKLAFEGGQHAFMPKEKKPEPVRESQSAVSQTRSSSTSQNRHSVESEPKVPVHKKSKSIAALLGEDPAMFEHAMRPGLQDNDKQQTRGSFLMLGGKTKSQSSLDSPRDSNTSNSPRPQKETILERRVEKAGVTISDLKLNIFKHLKKSSSSLAMEAGLNVESMTKVGSSGLEKRLGVSFSPKPNKKEWDESDASNPGSGTSTPNKIVHAQDWKKNTLAKTALTHSSSKLSVVSQDDLPSARSQDSVMDTTLGEHRYVAPKASIERKDDYLVNTPKEDAVDRKQAVKTSPKASPGHLDSGYVKSGTKQAFGSDEQLYAQDISKSFQDMAYIVNPLPSPGAEDPTDALTRILEQKPDRSDPLGRILQDNYEPQIRSPKTEKITRSTQLKQVTSWMNCKKNAETEFVHRYIVVQDGKLFIFTSDTQAILQQEIVLKGASFVESDKDKFMKNGFVVKSNDDIYYFQGTAQDKGMFRVRVAIGSAMISK